jgi:hypothetical protein
MTISLLSAASSRCFMVCPALELPVKIAQAARFGEYAAIDYSLNNSRVIVNY